jgi:hypothetical protein
VSQADSTEPGRPAWQKPQADIYTALLGIALGALVVSIILLAIELGRFGFETKPAGSSMVVPSSPLADPPTVTALA